MFNLSLNEYNLPYPDPIHAIVVHFVIAMVVFSVFFDIIGFFTRNQSFFNAGWWNLVVATLAVMVTIVFGQFEAALANPSQAAQPVLDRHMAMGWLLAVVLVNLTLWRGILRYYSLRSKTSLRRRSLSVYLGVGLLTVGLVFYQIYLGTELVWVHGLHVKPVVAAKRAEAVTDDFPGS